MPWFTTKDGRHVNTDWFTKDKQIQQNAEQAFMLNKQMNIPYDDWKHEDDKRITSEDGRVYGREFDNNIYIQDKDIRKVTKADTLRTLEEWKMDDDTYGTGTGDESIHIYYDDGSILELTDGEPHKRWKKQGIKGITISTADYEQVWGHYYDRKAQEWKLHETHEMDENLNDVPGYSNSYSGYKVTGAYKTRVEETNIYDPDKKRWITQRRNLRMSTVKKY